MFSLRQCCSFAQLVRSGFKVNQVSSKLNILFPSLIMFHTKDYFPTHPLNTFFFQVVFLKVMLFSNG